MAYSPRTRPMEMPTQETLPDYTMSLVKANVIGALALPLAAIVVLGPFIAIHGTPSFGKPHPFFVTSFVIAFVASIAIHEALHAAGFIFIARAPRKSVHFGVDRKTLTPFAGCKAPVRASHYRIASLLPAIVLGVIPSLIAIFNGSGALAIYGMLMLAAAGGDFAALLAMRKAPSDTLVLDHPSRVGCQAVEP